MENFRDEQIICSTCGLSFLFSAAEASVYAARHLAAPPKRCKDCRKARKEQLGSSEGTPARGAHSGRNPQQARGRHYTGDVNEYRSPMQDSFSFQTTPGRPEPAPPRRGFGRSPTNDGEYRSPSFPNEHARGASRGHSAHRAAEPTKKPAPARYPITCKACGAEAEVPFKPAEGRDLFCQPCYRARRAS